MKDNKTLEQAKELERTNHIAKTICNTTACVSCEYQDYGLDFCIYAMQIDIIKGKRLIKNGKRRSNSNN